LAGEAPCTSWFSSVILFSLSEVVGYTSATPSFGWTTIINGFPDSDIWLFRFKSWTPNYGVFGWKGTFFCDYRSKSYI